MGCFDHDDPNRLTRISSNFFEANKDKLSDNELLIIERLGILQYKFNNNKLFQPQQLQSGWVYIIEKKFLNNELSDSELFDSLNRLSEFEVYTVELYTIKHDDKSETDQSIISNTHLIKYLGIDKDQLYIYVSSNTLIDLVYFYDDIRENTIIDFDSMLVQMELKKQLGL